MNWQEELSRLVLVSSSVWAASWLSVGWAGDPAFLLCSFLVLSHYAYSGCGPLFQTSSLLSSSLNFAWFCPVSSIPEMYCPHSTAVVSNFIQATSALPISQPLMKNISSKVLLSSSHSRCSFPAWFYLHFLILRNRLLQFESSAQCLLLPWLREEQGICSIRSSNAEPVLSHIAQGGCLGSEFHPCCLEILGACHLMNIALW